MGWFFTSPMQWKTPPPGRVLRTEGNESVRTPLVATRVTHTSLYSPRQNASQLEKWDDGGKPSANLGEEVDARIHGRSRGDDGDHGGRACRCPSGRPRH